MTHNASWFVDYDELTFLVVEYNLDWGRGHWRFVPMDDVSATHTMSIAIEYCSQSTVTDSILSPFLTMVFGFATLPLMVVTPDSSAYLYSS